MNYKNDSRLEESSYLHIPMDEEDYRYTKSFTVDEAVSDDAMQFYDTYGFIIFKNVLSYADCQSTFDDFWSLLEEQKNSTLRRDDINTWNQGLSHFGMPKGSNAIFRPSLLRLRQNTNIHYCFASIIGRTDIMVSHDRWLLHRPTRNIGGVLGQDRLDWETRRNIHLDMNPWEFVGDDKANNDIRNRLSDLKYKASSRSFIFENNDVHKSMGRSVQGILNLNDVADVNSGGTILIPGSQKTFENWIQGSRIDTKQKTKGPMQYKVRNGDKLQSRAQHVTLRAGSLLLFDRRCFHGSTPNRSSSCRAAVPISFFDASLLRNDPQRARERAACIKREIENVGFLDELTAHGRNIFGLNLNG